MRRTREQLKAELMAEAEAKIDALLDYHERSTAPTLEEIEDTILELRKQLGERMAGVLVGEQEAAQSTAQPECPTCGQKMTYKGMRRTRVESRLGGVMVERAYYHCDRCRSGLFPPGQTTEAAGEELE
jgi:uncharacterized protein with PIN domain